MSPVETSGVAAFLVAAVALILAPGPDTVYVLTRGLQGRVAGVRSALGISAGVLLHTTAAALGLSAVLRAAPAAYAAVEYLGAAYLVYLGVQAVRNEEFAVDDAAAAGTDRPFLRGVLVNALNPKVALFFLAFLPQFAGGGPAGRMVALGATYAALTAAYLSCVALAAHRAGRALSTPRVRSALGWTAGGVLVALGLSVAAGGR